MNLFGAGAPAMLGAIKPQVIIVNNGPRKGLGQVDTAAQSLTRPGYQETAPGYAYDKIAALAGGRASGRDTCRWRLRITTPRGIRSRIWRTLRTARETGSRRPSRPMESSIITNGRNAFSKTYAAR